MRTNRKRVAVWVALILVYVTLVAAIAIPTGDVLFGMVIVLFAAILSVVTIAVLSLVLDAILGWIDR